jgi:hypothetical protein
MTDKDKAQIAQLANALEEAARLLVVRSMSTRTFAYDAETIQFIDDTLTKKPNFQRLLSLILRQHNLHAEMKRVDAVSENKGKISL